MIFRGDGDLLKTPADALVNTVNTVGVMGKGIALQFKLAFPDNYAAYEAACNRGDVQIGKMFVFRREKNPRLIINFPTKKHWKGKSKMEDIESGLKALIQVVKKDQINCGAATRVWQRRAGLGTSAATHRRSIS